MNAGEVLGRCIGEATTERVQFVSKKMPRIGEFVILECDFGAVLGMIETLARGSVAIPEDIFDPASVEKIRAMEGDEYYIQGSVRILGEVESMKIPRTPPPPGTRVMCAPPVVLMRIFGDPGNGIRLGTLVTQPEVPVYVHTNRMVTRHLAVLAMTGAGKSNTVAVIADGILGMRGTVLIFDMHSEYISASFTSGRVTPMRTVLNPKHLSQTELAKLANIHGERAYVQSRYFRMAYTTAIRDLQENTIGISEFFMHMKDLLDGYLEEERFRDDKTAINAVRNKIEEFEERYEQIIDLTGREFSESLVPGTVNVIDLGAVDEDAADVIVSHALRKILTGRKQYIRKREGIPFPLLIVLEEAHILSPKTRSTDSKYWISRVAREGRKFGVGLCLVSQSPKSLDPDSLSQMNNMIISRLIQPEDQRHVQSASESLSEDLLAQLASLNIGEAIAIGPMTKIPALVKIDEFRGRLVGGDIDVVGEWRRAVEGREQERDARRREIGQMEDY
ncbi:MAG: ATP-binding protein [Methanomicrobiales archaeon]|nr:ATP-binding protein [Methanomicrobiales archaeon]